MTAPARVLRYAPWPEDAQLDQFCGDWVLWQRRRGHRTSTDDLLCAWAAVEAVPRPERYCDLGCGVGSVLLMVVWAGRPSIAVGVEAQAGSVELALRTIAELPADGTENLSVLHGDFRGSIPAEFDGQFDLVTGSPPYLPVGTGVPSPDPQRFACRFETRGGVEEYLSTAARLLSPDGKVCVVFQTVWDARVMAAAAGAGLQLHGRTDAVMREGGAPFLTTYVFARRQPEVVDVRSLSIRDGRSEVTGQWRRARERMGLV